MKAFPCAAFKATCFGLEALGCDLPIGDMETTEIGVSILDEVSASMNAIRDIAVSVLLLDGHT